MNDRERVEYIDKIIKRADAMGIGAGSRAEKIMDIVFANRQFELRLKDWLEANDVDFAHDFTGIQANMNHTTCKVENLFLPRFATCKATKTAQMMFVAEQITTLVNRFICDKIEITYRRKTEESVKDYTEWDRQRFGIHSGFEYFYVWRGEMLYAVDVTADSVLTAAKELMWLLAAKF